MVSHVLSGSLQRMFRVVGRNNKRNRSEMLLAIQRSVSCIDREH